MTVAQTLQLDVSDLGVSRLIGDVLFELSELGLAREEIRGADVEPGDLGGIEEMGHFERDYYYT